MAEISHSAAAVAPEAVGGGLRPSHLVTARQKVVLFCDFLEDRRLSMERYTEELSRALATHCANELEVEQCRPRIPRLIGASPLGEINRMRIARYLGYPSSVRKRQGDINHVIDQGYGHLLYCLDPKRTVVTVHDLIPLLRWKGEVHGMAKGHRPWLSEFSFQALKRAARLIAISENTKRDLIRHIGCDPSRIEVIYWGIDHRFRPYPEEDRLRMRAQLKLPGPEAHVVLISGGVAYKNGETSLKVAVLLQRRCDRPVVLARRASPSASWDAAVREIGMEGRVVAVPHLPAGRMPDLYNAVDCLLFPSWYEGFGLPPLEAMACGTPVVTSDVASLPEVAGDAALMAAPDDIEGLADRVYGLLGDQTLRSEQVGKGLRQAAKFSWEQSARRTLQVYQQVLQEEQ